MKKTALITGASRGIGAAFAEILAREGYDLILTARDTDRLREVEERCRARYHRDIHTVLADLSDPQTPELLFKAIQAKNITVDVLINNAGFGHCGAYAAQTWENEAAMMQVNMVSLAALTKLFLPGMFELGRGHIVNVASTAAFQPGPLMAVYYATKSYVVSYSEALSEELRGTGVFVTALCPGPTATEFQATAQIKEQRLIHMKKMQTAQGVAEYGYAAMVRGRRLAIPGFTNKLFAYLVRFIPTSLILKIVHRLQSRRI